MRFHVAMPHCGMRPDSTSGGEVAEREVYRHLSALGVEGHVLDPSWYGLRWWNSPAQFHFTLSKCCRRDGPHLIRAHSLRYTGLAALVWGRHYGIPVSVHYHHLDPDRLAWLDRFVIRHADQVTTDSCFSRDQALLESPRVHVVRLGVDHTYFTPAPMPPGQHVLLVGGLKPRKNTAFVKRLWPAVLHRVPNARLIEFADVAGTLPDIAVPSWYRLARVVAFPSRLEGFGLPALEAMASARPVVCSDQGSLPEFGIETTPLIPEMWVDRLVTLLTDDEQWTKESEANHVRSGAYAWQLTAQRFATLWRSIGLGHPPPRP